MMRIHFIDFVGILFLLLVQPFSLLSVFSNFSLPLRLSPWGTFCIPALIFLSCAVAIFVAFLLFVFPLFLVSLLPSPALFLRFA